MQRAINARSPRLRCRASFSSCAYSLQAPDLKAVGSAEVVEGIVGRDYNPSVCRHPVGLFLGECVQIRKLCHNRIGSPMVVRGMVRVYSDHAVTDGSYGMRP